ncbi:ABC transporter permease [Patescibacteria group bacterium]|nr:ABC transporter permease [Patescibacteria group bacterium]
MINFNRVWALVIRYAIDTRHNYDRLTDVFFLPAMDLFVWGLTGLYLAQLTNGSENYLYVILSGLVFWVVVVRAQYEITINLLVELWDRNLVNLFTTPLKISEWISAFMVFGLFKAIIIMSFSALLAFIFYGYNIFSFGGYIILFIVNLLLTGWAYGFILGGFLIRFGKTIQTIGWVGIMLITPFSAVYYPVSVLPHWAQTVAYFIPSTYVFEEIRRVLFTGAVSYDKLLISFVLNIIYLSFSIWFFVWMFHKSRRLGLGRLI